MKFMSRYITKRGIRRRYKNNHIYNIKHSALKFLSSTLHIETQGFEIEKSTTFQRYPPMDESIDDSSSRMLFNFSFGLVGIIGIKFKDFFGNVFSGIICDPGRIELPFALAFDRTEDAKETFFFCGGSFHPNPPCGGPPGVT